MTDPKVHEILVAARDRIADPRHWCQRVGARNYQGECVIPTSDSARQWCAEGSVLAEVGGIALARSALQVLDQSAIDLGLIALKPMMQATATINDETDHSTVMLMYDRAIARTA